MPVSLEKPLLWNFQEVAEMFGLNRTHGFRTIGDLVREHAIETKPTGSGRARGLDRSDVNRLAKLLNKPSPWARPRAAV